MAAQTILLDPLDVSSGNLVILQQSTALFSRNASLVRDVFPCLPFLFVAPCEG